MRTMQTEQREQIPALEHNSNLNGRVISLPLSLFRCLLHNVHLIFFYANDKIAKQREIAQISGTLNFEK